MDDQLRGILSNLGIRINPAAEGTLQDVRDNIILGDPDHIAAIAVGAVETSHTITAGKKHVLLMNTGAKNVYWGGTGLGSATGIPLRPQNAYLFSNVVSGFKVYLICAAGETSTVRGVEFDAS